MDRLTEPGGPTEPPGSVFALDRVGEQMLSLLEGAPAASHPAARNALPTLPTPGPAAADPRGQAPTAPSASSPTFTPPPVRAIVAPAPVDSALAPVSAPAAATPGVRAATTTTERTLRLDDLLIKQIAREGSDLHLSVGAPPTIRVHGLLQPLAGYAPLTPQVLQALVYDTIDQRQRATFEQRKRLNVAHVIPGEGRFRMNVLQQRGHVGAVLRHIPARIRPLDELAMPASLAALTTLPNGLVLVAGPTGSGKSATVAALIDLINRTQSGKILTIEDPIEYEHFHQGCLVDMREVGEDTDSFDDALDDAMRQNPDYILVGEIREMGTISAALRAAETGHLVFATVHAQSAAETITRIVDVFPEGQRDQTRIMLASTVQAVVYQRLLRTADGRGRVPATEVLRGTTSTRSMIRSNQLQQIPDELLAGSAHGMHSFLQSLVALVTAGQITYDEALAQAPSTRDFTDLIGGPDGAAAAARQRAAQARTGLGGATPGLL